MRSTIEVQVLCDNDFEVMERRLYQTGTVGNNETLWVCSGCGRHFSQRRGYFDLVNRHFDAASQVLEACPVQHGKTSAMAIVRVENDQAIRQCLDRGCLKST